jgi:lipopolysaccharide export system protein LptC
MIGKTLRLSGATGVATANGPRLAGSAAYRRALRHSRLVGSLRLGLPVACAALVGFIGWQLAGNPFAREVSAPVAAEYGLSGSRITMQTPVLQGFKRDGKPYRLDAEAAEQDIRAPHVVELHALDARMGEGKAGWVRMISAKGVFDNRKETLVLPVEVRLRTDAGYLVKLGSADVELRGGIIRSQGNVDVTSPDGVMTSDNLEVRGNGNELLFTGRVRTTLVSERPAQTGSQPVAKKD